MTTTAPYGSWRSPLGADQLAAARVGLGDIVLDGESTYWVENRPAEAGRAAIVRLEPGTTKPADVIPAPYSARSAVHEYGGGAFTVHRQNVFFVNFSDQDLYRCRPGDTDPERLTDSAELRYADLLFDPQRQRLICVCEDHSGDGEARNTLVAAGLDGRQQTLAEGADFYASATLSPDAKRLAWLCWHHPRMPWDGTELWQAEFAADGSLTAPQRLAGGAEESIFQPQWSPDGRLYFVSDRSGWWNLYRYSKLKATAEPLTDLEAEFGLPQWVFAMSTYGFDDQGAVICAYRERGDWRLARLDTDAEPQQLQPLPTPYTQIDGLRVHNRRAVFTAGSATAVSAVVSLDLASGASTPLRQSTALTLPVDTISTAQALSFPSADGRTAHAFFYPPKNADFRPPSGELPPLLVKSHGGPTASTSSALDLNIQYWTSRGFAVVDVNYGGSTGYGRDYRRLLYGQWGVVDVQDCVAAARHLIDTSQVDGERCAIRGSSAGGYTTLAALTFTDLFSASASYYGISDLEVLARDTHKFESKYMDQLVGPYPASRELYRQRSPIHFCERLTAPVIFLQGQDDKVVPPNQAELMVEALDAKKIPVALLLFEGERHGFRQAVNLRRALEAELYFYSRMFAFTPADIIEPVEIRNLIT